MKNDGYAPRWPIWLTGTITALVMVFLTAPLFILVIQSFTSASYLSFPPPGYGVRWYSEVLSASDWREAITLSLIVALIVAPLALLIGTMAALGLDRGPLKGRRALFAFLISPMILPHVVLGLAMFRLALLADLIDTIPAYVLAHLTICVPYVVITVGASLQTFDETLEEAAISLGASPLRALWHITLPVIRPGLIGGGIFAFIVSFDEFIITYFLATFEQTLPLQIFSTLMFQVEPSIAAVSTLMLGATGLLTALLMSRGQVVSGGKVIQ